MKEIFSSLLVNCQW